MAFFEPPWKLGGYPSEGGYLSVFLNPLFLGFSLTISIVTIIGKKEKERNNQFHSVIEQKTRVQPSLTIPFSGKPC
jgi:hypothetical protein